MTATREEHIPDGLRRRWRHTLDFTARTTGASVSCVVRLFVDEIETLVRAGPARELYPEGERAPLGTGLYAETVVRTGRELIVGDARTDPVWSSGPELRRGMVSFLGLPLTWPAGQVFGAICVLHDGEKEHSRLERSVLAQSRDLVEKDLAILEINRRLRLESSRRQRAERLLDQTRASMMAASRHAQLNQERERSELGRQLHDEVIQVLTAMKMDIANCLSRMPAETADSMQSTARSLVDAVDSLVLRMRLICDSLVPPVLEDLGLQPAVEWQLEEFTRRTGLPCTVTRLDDMRGVPLHVTVVMFRVLQQALNHIGTPPLANGISLELVRTKARVTMTVFSSGHADVVDQRQMSELIGLTDLAEQIRSWGGRLRTWRTPEGEAILQVYVPVNAQP